MADFIECIAYIKEKMENKTFIIIQKKTKRFEAKYVTHRALWPFCHPIALSPETLPHLLNHLLCFHGVFSNSFFFACI
jgi:hypothetical protein